MPESITFALIDTLIVRFSPGKQVAPDAVAKLLAAFATDNSNDEKSKAREAVRVELLGDLTSPGFEQKK